jgi:hypothetical protein
VSHGRQDRDDRAGPDEITPEQVARLRQENQTLRAELDRARAS